MSFSSEPLLFAAERTGIPGPWGFSILSSMPSDTLLIAARGKMGIFHSPYLMEHFDHLVHLIPCIPLGFHTWSQQMILFQVPLDLGVVGSFPAWSAKMLFIFSRTQQDFCMDGNIRCFVLKFAQRSWNHHHPGMGQELFSFLFWQLGKQISWTKATPHTSVTISGECTVYIINAVSGGQHCRQLPVAVDIDDILIRFDSRKQQLAIIRLAICDSSISLGDEMIRPLTAGNRYHILPALTGLFYHKRCHKGMLSKFPQVVFIYFLCARSVPFLQQQLLLLGERSYALSG